MTSELKADGRRRRFHHRSKSSIGDYTSPIHQDPISHIVQMKESPIAGKQDPNRSWFTSKVLNQRHHDVASDLVVDDEKPSQQHRVVQGLYRDDDGRPSPKTLTTSHSAARNALREFAKDFVAQLKKGDPDETLTMESQMRQLLRLPSSAPPTVPLKFVVEAYIVHHFFSDFENASFGIPNAGEKPWEVQDHMRRCFAQFQRCKIKSQTVSTLLEIKSTELSQLSFLSHFCVQKFRIIVPSAAFFGGDSHHHLELAKGNQPNTPFYRSFLSAAVSVWLLQRLVFSFEQKIVPIIPTRGDAYQRRFMTPAVPGVGDAEGEENDYNLEIAFTVFPGFRVSESVVLSSVYIVEPQATLPKMEIPTSTSVVEPPVETSHALTIGERHTLRPESLVDTVETSTALPKMEIPTSTSVVEPAVETPHLPYRGEKHTLRPESMVYTVGSPIILPKMEIPTSVSITEPPVGTPFKSLKDKEHGLLQRLRSKFVRKKTLAKGTLLDEKSAPVIAASPIKEEQVSPRGESASPLQGSAPSTAEAAPSLEESAPSRREAAPLELEPSPPTDGQAEQNTTTSVTNPASELSTPKFQSPNLEVTDSQVPPPSGVNGDLPLYIPRARKTFQPPQLSPQLSSVD